MIKEISQKLYTILSDDITLQGLLPNVIDGSNVREMRSPKPSEGGTFPVIVYRVRIGTPVRDVRSLDVLRWYAEIDIIGNETSMSNLWDIEHRVYDLLHDRNLTFENGIAYSCERDFIDTAYDDVTLMTFITTRYEIVSREKQQSNVGDLS